MLFNHTTLLFQIPVSSSNKTDRCDMTEIMLILALNNINHKLARYLNGI